ncbi:hypothetical protein TNIN_6291 [Trichonephila inaurata madagascariensis]|uniref:Uncharacterized protein n=1 Tax=Trichonephila inaurata madagascariensis TaxID=2747483 RepID=A0A8X7BSN4_9ARAC|nr:hypothetical protein TNIN_6291 [Trichonephila inaurata madagascariensis]
MRKSVSGFYTRVRVEVWWDTLTSIRIREAIKSTSEVNTKSTWIVSSLHQKGVPERERRRFRNSHVQTKGKGANGSLQTERIRPKSSEPKKPPRESRKWVLLRLKAGSRKTAKPKAKLKKKKPAAKKVAKTQDP